jgi:hypothetical protein
MTPLIEESKLLATVERIVKRLGLNAKVGSGDNPYEEGMPHVFLDDGAFGIAQTEVEGILFGVVPGWVVYQGKEEPGHTYRDNTADAPDWNQSTIRATREIGKAIKEMFTAYVGAQIDDVFTSISEEEEVTEL